MDKLIFGEMAFAYIDGWFICIKVLLIRKNKRKKIGTTIFGIEGTHGRYDGEQIGGS